MEKSTGLAVIALIIAFSSITITYLEYVPSINSLDNQINALQQQLNDLQNQELITTEFTVPFSRALNRLNEGYVRELIPRPSEPFLARSIMITFEYQFDHYETPNVIIGMIYADSSIEVPTAGNVVVSQEAGLTDSSEGKMSLSTGLIPSESQAEELVILIAATNITGNINGTITQIVIR